MRIALVSEHASPLAVLGGADAGGQNVHVSELALALGRQGAEVVVHTRRDDRGLPRQVPFGPGVVVDHVPAGPPEPIPKDELLPWMAAFADELASAWRTDPPDAVHSHFWMSGLATRSASHLLGLPMLHTFHALGSEKRHQQGGLDTSPPQRDAVEAELAREADALLATTAAEARALEAMGAPTSRVRVVPCGVDLRRFSPHGRTWARGASGRARIVVAGRLVARKGIAEVIRALPNLPGADLVLAGGPPGAMILDDPVAAALADLADQLGVANRVSLLGSVSRRDMPALLRSADVVACCPWYEPFGLVALEAMACGVPVLATAVGGLAETVVDGVTGVHVPPRDPAAIAEALDRLLSRPDERLRMGRAAARRARRYGWDGIAAQTLDVVRGLVGARLGSEVS
jgi:D-inositol-3-phosphate glycosyltransferase